MRVLVIAIILSLVVSGGAYAGDDETEFRYQKKRPLRLIVKKLSLKEQ